VVYAWWLESSAATTTTGEARQLAFEDDTLIGGVKLTDTDDASTRAMIDSELTATEQAVLLGLCSDVKNNNPKCGLTSEEMWPYVERVLKRCVCVCVCVCACVC